MAELVGSPAEPKAAEGVAGKKAWRFEAYGWKGVIQLKLETAAAALCHINKQASQPTHHLNYLFAASRCA